MSAPAIPTFDQFKKQSPIKVTDQIPTFDDFVAGKDNAGSTGNAKADEVGDPYVEAGKVARAMVSNLPESAGKFITGMATSLRHPIDTGNALAKSIGGVAQRYLPSTQKDLVPYGDALVQGVKDRVGSIPAVINTLKTDPVGLASDVSALASGIGGLARGASATSRLLSLPRAASTIGKVADIAMEVSDAANPVMATGKALGKIPIPDKLTPAGMYASAIKIPPALKGGVPARDQILATGIREGIPVSRSGFDETGNRIEQLLAEDKAKIAAQAGQPGSDINPLDVTKPVNRLNPTFAEQVNPDADLAAINRSKREFLDKHSTSAPYTAIAPNPYGGNGMVPVGSGVVKTKQPIPLLEAQAEKTGTYRQLRGKYGELGAADIESQKALARGLKDEIAKRVPGLQGARESDLIALEEKLARFVGREGNKNLVGLIPAVIGAGLGAFAGHPLEGGAAGLTATMAVLAMDNPAIKSQIAIALDRAKSLKGAATVGARAANVAGVAGEQTPPKFAKGGIAGLHGPEKITVGDGGEPEAIIPLHKLAGGLIKPPKPPHIPEPLNWRKTLLKYEGGRITK